MALHTTDDSDSERRERLAFDRMLYTIAREIVRSRRPLTIDTLYPEVCKHTNKVSKTQCNLRLRHASWARPIGRMKREGQRSNARSPTVIVYEVTY